MFVRSRQLTPLHTRAPSSSHDLYVQALASLTPQEQEELLWVEAFNTLDRNGNGKIERIEIVQTLREPETNPEFTALLHDVIGLPKNVAESDGE